VINTYPLIPLEYFGAMASKALHDSLDGFVIGVIGMGDMGKMYARRLSDAGWR
jgi:prephenate dehydrogenase (NADP+)